MCKWGYVEGIGLGVCGEGIVYVLIMEYVVLVVNFL